ncbi:MAG: ABC-2 family transporter protein [Firmicutes bacterium ADurb.Bin506]|nr:MAG: ABC-2 family transporter protein [Firmicutes bacterium ADurb.Bin506]
MRHRGMNRRAAVAIARKDIRGITSNVQVWLPMLIVPLIFCLVLPVILGVAMRSGDSGDAEDLDPMLALVDKMPGTTLKTKIDAMDSPVQRLIYLMFNHLFAPLFLLIPIMAASTIAADSFVGEKERGTFESLLLAPIDLMSMFVGKVMAAWVPAVVVSAASFVLYGVSSNIAAWPLFGYVFFPHINWLPLMVIVMPAVSLLSVEIMVMVSTRMSTFQAAYQMSVVLIFPILALMIAQVTGVMILDTVAFAMIGVGIIIIDLILLRLIVGRLDRSRMFESQVR